ncbi:MAG: o-succinylbenzoate synthase [Bernardetiaceae bacterium]|nr:o-succinylbenzoate synthase [Bernardetiaceae bacterium]
MNTNYKIYTHRLDFRFDAGTSRGILRTHQVYYVVLSSHGITGVGEAAPLRGLSLDDIPDFGKQASQTLASLTYVPDFEQISTFVPAHLPSLRFALETAVLDWQHKGQRMIFDHDFYRNKQPLPINGLIWMGEADFMQAQISQKIKEGFSCIKMKIGAIDFDTEISLLKSIREKFDASQITLRVDANGAFLPSEAPEKLARLADLDLHSIEQPIAAGQVDAMAKLCRESPIAIALDEELIPVQKKQEKRALLQTIKPPFIILKPTLLGGIAATQEWIEVAQELGIAYWLTSALESNIGLNAISQFCATLNPKLPQGLGTGQLYSNNIPSPLSIERGHILYDKHKKWLFDINDLQPLDLV